MKLHALAYCNINFSAPQCVPLKVTNILIMLAVIIICVLSKR